MKHLAFIVLKLLKLKMALRCLRINSTLTTALSNRCYYYAHLQMRKLGFGEVMWISPRSHWEQ